MSSQENKGLENLQVWQMAMKLAVKTCKEFIPLLPNEEKYVLSDQIRRAVQSVPANIAEGYGRFYYQDDIRFYYTARGSLAEVYSHLSFAYQMNYISKSTYESYISDLRNLYRALNGYIAHLKRVKQSEQSSNHSIQVPIAEYSLEYDDLLTDEAFSPTNPLIN